MPPGEGKTDWKAALDEALRPRKDDDPADLTARALALEESGNYPTCPAIEGVVRGTSYGHVPDPALTGQQLRFIELMARFAPECGLDLVAYRESLEEAGLLR